MHEMSLMAGIFEIINQHLANYPGARVLKVTLKVGQMTNAVPEALEFCFAAFAKGTAAQDAQLEIIRVHLKVKCRECGNESEPEEYKFLCSHCGSPAVEIIQGRELAIESMEVE